ncbi:MAG: short-chain fatty acyl-CoA regulator family protein [Paracoccaceae bacterium]|nr:short-chain fatty acyl-CoA regulator family protein [Paracoccaceae bacterium]
MTTHLTGLRIRERRKALGLRQSELARICGISPSYLNLIEHGKRPVAGKLLLDISSALKVDVARLSDGTDSGLVRRLGLAAQGNPGAELEQVDEFIGRFPGWAQLIARMQTRIDQLEQTIEALGDRLSQDPHLTETIHEILSSVTAIHSTASILVQTPAMETGQQRRFQTNIHQESARLSDLSRSLAGFFDRLSEEEAGHALPLDELDAFLARHDYHFPTLEAGQAAGQADVDALIGEAPELTSRAGRLLARDFLERYVAGANKMPLAAFLENAAAVAFDPVRLAREYDVDFSDICRRLAFLPTGAGVPAFGLILCDGTGAILLRKPLSGFSMPRYSPACALWPLYQAISRPHLSVSAVLETPEKQEFLAIAESRYIDLDTPQAAVPVQRACMLFRRFDSGLPEASVALPRIPVGPSCRICPRSGCGARREPSIHAPLA